MVRLEQPKIIYHLPDFPLKKSEDKGGIYAILPYEKLDKNNKALFKVGLANNFAHRFEQYHTYYPFGFYYKNLLSNPVKGKEDFVSEPHHEEGKRPTPDERDEAKYRSKIRYLKHIENYVFDKIEQGVGRDKGQRLLTSTRVKNADKKKSKFGETEWFYTDEKVLNNAFEDAFKVFGKDGKTYNYKSHLDDINKNAENAKKNATYTAEIHYKIYK